MGGEELLEGGFIADIRAAGLKAADLKRGIGMKGGVDEDLVKRVLVYMAKRGANLTKRRAQKFIYLVERECVLDTGKPCFNLDYINHNYGMYSRALDKIYRQLSPEKDGLEVKDIQSKHGPGHTLKFTGGVAEDLPKHVKRAVDRVLATYVPMNPDAFILFAKSTSPYIYSKKGERLNWQALQEKSYKEAEERLNRALTESRSILELRDNWDEEGSPRFSEHTWKRAVEFLLAEWSEYFREQGCPMIAPDILPSKGSIDLQWDTDEFELLVNIPADPRKRASTYGESHGQHKIEDNLDPSKPSRGLVRWMAKVEGLHSPKSRSPMAT